MDPLVVEIYIDILKRKKHIRIVEQQDNICRVDTGSLPYMYLLPKGIKEPTNWVIKDRKGYKKYKA